MKKNFTEFECDTCHKTITKIEGQGFPYSEGWEYLYNFDGQTPRADNEKMYGRFKEKDKHFCGKECEFRFIEKIVNIAGGSEKAEDVVIEAEEEIEAIDIKEDPVMEPESIIGDLSMEELERQKLERAKAVTSGEVKEPLSPEKKDKETDVLKEIGVDKVN